MLSHGRLGLGGAFALGDCEGEIAHTAKRLGCETPSRETPSRETPSHAVSRCLICGWNNVIVEVGNSESSCNLTPQLLPEMDNSSVIVLQVLSTRSFFFLCFFFSGSLLLLSILAAGP